MPKKTLYIRKEDVEIWEKAVTLSKSSLSNYITELLKMEIDKKMGKALDGKTNFTKLVVEVDDGKGELLKKVSFIGKWLVESEREDNEFHPFGTVYSVAITLKNSFFVLSEKFGAQEFHAYFVYNSFQDMVDSKIVTPGILSAVADELDLEYEEFLDI